MPLWSIAEAIHAAGLRAIGLLGSVFMMKERFFRDGLERSGIAVLVPGTEDQQLVNHVIYQELCRGEVRPGSRWLFLEIIERLRAQGSSSAARRYSCWCNRSTAICPCPTAPYCT